MKGIIVVKIGGIASDNLTEDFFYQLTSWKKQGKKVVIVHGGGHYISEMMDRLKISVTIKNGLRVTTKETLAITQMVLIGQVQPMITTKFQQAGFSVVGLNASSAQIITGDFLDKKKYGYVGNVKQIDKQLLLHLIEEEHVPIIAPLGMTEVGQWLNINADNVACKVAEELKAEALYLLTDVPGVRKEKEWLQAISPKDISQLKEENVIQGGMLPKVESAVFAATNGVNKVHITNEIRKFGTTISAEEAMT